MIYRLIALDLDGTLLNSQLEIREDSIASIRQADALGIKVLIVTGRHHTAARYYWHQLGINTPAICCNGAYVYDFCEDVLLPGGSPLTKAQAHEVLRLSKALNIPSLVYTTEHINYESGGFDKFYLLDWAKTLPVALRPEIRAVDSLINEIEQAPTVWKLISFNDDPVLLDELADKVRETLGLSCERSGKKHLDIMSANVNKGKRLTDLIRHYGISPDEVIAFGDQQNDIQMLKMAGMGVAMGNGIGELRNFADWVTASNNEGGVALALQRFVLGVS